MIKAIIFDCGDTLLQMKPPPEIIFRDAAAELGLMLPRGNIARAYETVGAEIKINSSRLSTTKAKNDFYLAFNAALCASLGISQHLNSIHPLLLERFSQRRRWVPFSDTKDTLEMMSERIPLHVLANWDSDLESLLQEAGLREFFQVVLSSAELGAEKPERACYLRFLRRAGLSAGEAIYVGNEYQADVVGSRAAGLTPILVDRRQRCAATDCLRVNALSDLPAALAPYLRWSLLPSGS